MDFTNKLISNTYGNVMVSDGFTNDTHNVSSVSPEDYKNSFVNVYDGYGNQSNLYPSIQVEDSTIYPNLKYGNGMVLPGITLSSYRVIIGNIDNQDRNSSLSTCNVALNADNVQIGDIKYPHTKFDSNKTIYIKDNTLTSGESISQTTKYQREETEVIDREIIRGEAFGGGCYTYYQYSFSVNLQNYISYTDDLVTIWLQIYASQYYAGWDHMNYRRPPFIVCKYNNLYFKICGPAIDSNGYYINDSGDRITYKGTQNVKGDGDQSTLVHGYDILGTSPSNIIGGRKNIWGIQSDVRLPGTVNSEQWAVNASTIALPVNKNNSTFTLYSLMSMDDGHYRTSSSSWFGSPNHYRAATFSRVVLSKITKLKKY